MVGGSGPGGKGPGGPGGVGGASGPGSGGVGGSGPGGKGPGGPGGVGGVSGPSPGTPGTAPGNPGAGTGTSPSTATPNQSIQAMQTARESFSSPSNLNPSLVAMVADARDSNSRTAQSRATMDAVSMVQPATRDVAQAVQNAVAKSEVGKATDDGIARSLAESVIGFPVATIADVAENAIAATNVNDSAVSVSEAMSLPDSFFGEVSVGDATNAAIGVATNDAIGDSDAVSKATLGLPQAPSVDGPSPDGGPSLIADEMVEQEDFSGDIKENSSRIGDIINYSSYTKSVFS